MNLNYKCNQGAIYVCHIYEILYTQHMNIIENENCRKKEEEKIFHFKFRFMNCRLYVKHVNLSIVKYHERLCAHQRTKFEQIKISMVFAIPRERNDFEFYFGTAYYCSPRTERKFDRILGRRVQF